MKRTTPLYPKMSSTKPSDGHHHRAIPGLYTCTIMAYPSVGGIVVGQFTGVELEWLRIPRSSPESYCRIPTDEESLKEEDAFALRLLQLADRWWPRLEFKGKHPDGSYPYGYHYPPDLHVGYPSASSSRGNKHPILVLKTFDGECIRLPEHNPLEKPNDWSRLAACGTMEERCAVLRDFGATEWDDMKKCPDIPQSLGEGMAEGKKYEELLRKMEDVEYLDKWMMSL